MRTYLIEPQLVFADYLRRCLSGAGYDVIATSAEVDGRDLVAHDPAAVFVDVDFFERGGPNALCKIRQAMPHVRLIVFSAFEDATYAASCYISGADAMISKTGAEENVVADLRRLVGIQ